MESYHVQIDTGLVGEVAHINEEVKEVKEEKKREHDMSDVEISRSEVFSDNFFSYHSYC
jgi:hypothetical protein